MDDELTRVFVTMSAKADMTMFDWARHIEELRHAIAKSIAEKDWGWLRIYGPDSSGFDQLPGICIEAQVTTGALGEMLEYLAEAKPWLNLPIYVYVSKGVVH